ncbi:hypothetical protein EMCRGX_G031961 [Ephydatia muelleri]
MGVATVLLLFSHLQLVFSLTFVNVTETIGLGRTASRRLLTYSDFNADKATDILVVTDNGTGLALFVWNGLENSFEYQELNQIDTKSLVEVQALDFDGDGALDILVVSEQSHLYTVCVYWGEVMEGVWSISGSLVTLDASLQFPPVVLDANGDHLPDIFGYTGNRTLRSFGRQWLLVSSDVGLLPSVLAGHYVDLNSDCLSDLILEGVLNGQQYLEIWLRKLEPFPNTFHLVEHVLLPISNGLGRRKLSFIDIDGDSVLDILLFSCDAVCESHVLYQSKFADSDILHCRTSESWSLSFKTVSTEIKDWLILDDTSPVVGKWSRVFWSDLNLDGFPDIIVMGINQNVEKPLLLMNVLCQSPSTCLRTLSVTDNQLPAVSNAIITATFFDLWEDGILDVLMLQNGTHRTQLVAYQHKLTNYYSFLKVLVLSGYCFDECSSRTKPYGSVLPGAVVAFSTTDRNGMKRRSVETPNFVENLVVGAGHKGSASNGWYHQALSLVPNSQLIVITEPPSSPSRWRIQLYLTPSHLIYSTAAVFSVIFVAIAIIIGLLQAREKYQDTKERKEAKHKFHFSAM